jgi:hypothetical protein
MYVNMHELATMAASKAQEMNFPPPPPELITIPPENQEKVSDLRPDNRVNSLGITGPPDFVHHLEFVC